MTTSMMTPLQPILHHHAGVIVGGGDATATPPPIDRTNLVATEEDNATRVEAPALLAQMRRSSYQTDLTEMDDVLTTEGSVM